MKEQRKQFFKAFLAYMVQRGISLEILQSRSGIDIKRALEDVDFELSENDSLHLWRTATEVADDNFFGLHFGESLQLGAISVVGEIIKSSGTVGEALTIAKNFVPVISSAFAMEVEKSKTQIVVSIQQVQQLLPIVSRQIVDFLVTFTVHELKGFLLRKIQPESLVFPYSIQHTSEYERIFQCVPKYEDHTTKITFQHDLWDEPIITANYELQQFLLKKITSAGEGLPDATSFSARVSTYLLTNAFQGIHSLNDVAANFNMTSRSLQRKLQDEGVTFQQLSDDVKKTLAMQYIESGNFKLKEISYFLGYNELSAFSRAFKRWTGKSPLTFGA